MVALAPTPIPRQQHIQIGTSTAITIQTAQANIADRMTATITPTVTPTVMSADEREAIHFKLYSFNATKIRKLLSKIMDHYIFF